MEIDKPLPTKQPHIGQLIRAIRLESGLTQEQFAAELGVVYPTVNRWENGRAKPSPMALKLIELKLKELGDKGQNFLRQYSGENSR